MDSQLQALAAYLKQRGFYNTESALRNEISAQTDGKTVDRARFLSREGPGKDDDERREEFRRATADELVYEKAYEQIGRFVHEALDLHRPEFTPVLLPVFVHSYLELVSQGAREAADSFFKKFANEHYPAQATLLLTLHNIRLPLHIEESEIAQRWLKNKFFVRMSERGLDLLLAWAMGGGKNVKGNMDPKRPGPKRERGDERGTVWRIFNEHVKFEKITSPNPSPSDLLSGLLPDLSPSTTATPPVKSLAPLKLGAAPLEPKFKREVLRELGEPFEVDTSLAAEVAPPPEQPSWVPPLPGDLPPYPSTFKTVDVAREAEAIRQARKRIRLSADAFEKDESRVNERVFTAYGVPGRRKTKGEKEAEGKKPSVCMFTIHDAGETLTSMKFSRDASLMATGFSESYIRLWNLKGEPLRPYRSDFDPALITKPSQLKRSSSTSPTLKLISHSGPVYSLAFDPASGPASPPRFLLSASQDASVRLWSMHTFSPIVAYKGHRDPVWDVDWGPRGVYFVTGGRDRTARLWNTERVVSIRIFSGHLSDVDVVRFHPNSLYVATGSGDRTCRLWDVATGDCVRLFTGHAGPVSCLAISPDGKLLASAEDKEIKLFDIGTSKLIKSMTGHTSRINSLSFSAESSILASGSHDETVRIWDVKAHSEDKGDDGRLKGLDDLDMDMLRRGEKRNRDLLATLYTKQTPVFETTFTERNLCLAGGPLCLPVAI